MMSGGDTIGDLIQRNNKTSAQRISEDINAFQDELLFGMFSNRPRGPEPIPDPTKSPTQQQNEEDVIAGV